MNLKNLAFGTVMEIQVNGDMVVAFSPGQSVLANVKDGRGVQVDGRAKLSFTKETVSGPISIGDEIACEWRGSSVGRWTFGTTYRYARQLQENVEQDNWDAYFQQTMMDDEVVDVIIPRVKKANPQLEIPAFPSREKLDEYHRKANGLLDWFFLRSDRTKEMKHKLLDDLAIRIFAKKNSS